MSVTGMYLFFLQLFSILILKVSWDSWVTYRRFKIQNHITFKNLTLIHVFFSHYCFETMAFLLSSSKFDNCNSLLFLFFPSTWVNLPESIQDIFTRFIFFISRIPFHVTAFLKSLHWIFTQNWINIRIKVFSK